MSATRTESLFIAGLLALLQACASSAPVPVSNEASAAAREAEPKITLNLPDGSSEHCAPVVDADYTFLEKGFGALAAGDHIEAVQYFQRYQRLEASPRADWEAGIAIAFDSMLPHSPFYDPAAARASYQMLRTQAVDKRQVHEKARFMQSALETFLAMQRTEKDLRQANAELRQELKKREEALKRLRALALGQKGAGQ